MITKLQLQNRKNELIGYIDISDCLKFERTHAINGEHTLEITLSTSNVYKDDFIKYNKIMYFDDVKNIWYEFIIQEIKLSDYIELYCENSIYELTSCFVPFLSITGNTVITGLTELLSVSSPVSSFNVGTSDISGTYSLQRTQYNALTCLRDWAEKVGGEIDVRVEWLNGAPIRYIDIVQSIGANRSKTIYDDREITEFKVDVPVEDYYTAAYAYGEIVDEVQLGISDVVWSAANGDPIDKPLGQAYVTLSDAVREQFGVFIGGEFRHRFTKFEEQKIKDGAELISAAYNFLVANIIDKTGYSLTVADLYAMGYQSEEIRLGDTVNISVARLGLKTESRIIKVTENALNPIENKFEFNFKQRYITDTINNLTSTATEAQTTANISYSRSILNAWNNEINAGTAYISATATDGLTVYNAPTAEEATKAIQLKGGSLRIANSKIAGEWSWSTVGTGDGLIADAITTGRLKGDNFELDLQTGILSFGERVNGILAPVLQFTATGQIIYGDTVNLEQTATSMRYYNKITGRTIAEFTSAYAKMPVAYVENLLMVGKTRQIPLDEEHACMWVIND